MKDVQTTRGLFNEESRREVIEKVCRVFDCQQSDIEEFTSVKAGLTNAG